MILFILFVVFVAFVLTGGLSVMCQGFAEPAPSLSTSNKVIIAGILGMFVILWIVGKMVGA